jgi:outer membrane receptor protein involved in Fe transport
MGLALRVECMHRAVVVAALLVVSLAAPVAGQPVLSAGDSSLPAVDEAAAGPIDQSPADATGVSGTSSDGQTATIDKRVELFLTPEEPGRIDVVVAYTLPDAVSSL